jgi:spore coat protein U-like protein
MNSVVNYNVFIDAARTQIWGDGSAGTSFYAFTNFFGTFTYSGSAYGTVPGAQDLAPGTYNDVFTATLSYQPGGGGTWTNLTPVNVPVSMNVQPECRADTFDLTFGNYSPLSGSPLNKSTVVKIYCTKNTPATFTLDNGANPSGTQKRMKSGIQFLNYTATLATTSGTSTSALTPIGGGITLNGSVPVAQDVATGAYVDTLQVLVNY